MARPKKCRRICSEPAYSGFMPDGIPCREKVILTVDEYEAIRLIDIEKFTHQQCAKQMDISRTTATEVYEKAREKIADCIVNGKPLLIAGGDYRLCDGSAIGYCHRVCRRTDKNSITLNKKGADLMRIAVTYDNGEVFQHFGHTEQFKIYDVTEGQIKNEEIIDTDSSGHGALAGLLLQTDVDMLICGGIGAGAQNALAEAGIELFGGVTGSADEAVRAYINNSLDYNPNVHCDHHNHTHHDSCGEDKHGCHGSCHN